LSLGAIEGRASFMDATMGIFSYKYAPELIYIRQHI